nr:hypothetical protein CFP56_54046 [Quercus suber]
MAITPPTTRSKGNSKIGTSVWDDPATALGQAHNIIMDDELKGLTSIPSHELVTKSSKIIEAINETNKAKEKIKELNEALRVEKMLIIQKDEEIHAALLRTDSEQKQAEATVAARGEDVVNARQVDPSQGDEAITPPP